MARRTQWINMRSSANNIGVSTAEMVAIIGTATSPSNRDLRGVTVARTIVDIAAVNDSATLMNELLWGVVMISETVPTTEDLNMGTEEHGWVLSGQLVPVAPIAVHPPVTQHRESRGMRKMGDGHNELRFYAENPLAQDGINFTVFVRCLILLP